MELKGERIAIRPWREGDEEALVRHGNDRAVWRNLGDRFPHPYTRETAECWIEQCRTDEKLALALAIELEGEAVGGIGLERKDDVCHRTAELGYWLGRIFWGQGITTEAVHLMVHYGFREAGFARIQATFSNGTPRRRACSKSQTLPSRRDAERPHSKTANSSTRSSTRGSTPRRKPLC